MEGISWAIMVVSEIRITSALSSSLFSLQNCFQTGRANLLLPFNHEFHIAGQGAQSVHQFKCLNMHKQLSFVIISSPWHKSFHPEPRAQREVNPRNRGVPPAAHHNVRKPVQLAMTHQSICVHRPQAIRLFPSPLHDRHRHASKAFFI